MSNEKNAVLLRIYVKESDTWQGKPLHIAIVEEAHRQGLAGATILRGVVGFGLTSSIQRSASLEISAESPMVIEIVDWADRAESFVESVSGMMDRGLITGEPVQVLWYSSPRDAD